MKPKLSFRRSKSVIYSLMILLIVTVFVAGYFFYYIPRSTATVHDNGFLILESIAKNVQDKVEGHSNFFRNIYRTGYARDTLRILLSENNIKATIHQSGRNNITARSESRKSAPVQGRIISSVRIENNNLVYSYKTIDSGDSVVFSESLVNFMQPILLSQKRELFESYAIAAVINKRSQLIFTDDNFGIRYDINMDTLLPRNVQAYFPGIVDLNSSFKHKMFYSPFQLESYQLMLMGFSPTSFYLKKTRQVPFAFIYPLAIAFILLLVFMPILKFKVMDSNEQVRIRDIFLFGLSVFAGVSVLTLVIIQFLLWKGEEKSVRKNLAVLSKQIENSFSTELTMAVSKLVELDSFRKADPYFISNKKKGRINYRDRIRNYLSSRNNNSRNYHFDRVNWVDTADGMQVGKAEVYGHPIFTNVQERNYYKALKNGNPLTIRLDSQAIKFAWEPIYSWTNADFNLSFAIQDDEYMAVLATKMYSVVGALLPVGYGFCIIDNRGEVLLHSEGSRNLMENIFKKAVPSRDLIGMVAGRQEGYLNDVSLYGKWHILGVKPIKQIPYTLITFYDKGFIVPVNMRILTFALLFSIISILFSVLLLVLLSKVAFRHPLLYSPMDFLSWLPPKKKEQNFYFHGLSYVFIYLVLLITSIALYKSYIVSNFTIFSIVFLTPLNIICGLYILSEVFNRVNQNNAGAKLKSKVIWVAALHLMVSFVYYMYVTAAGFPINKFYWAVQILFNLWMWSYIFLSRRPASFFTVNLMEWMGYRRNYNLLATSLVICLSVLPSGLYIWYAHNQEIIQSVKKHQLHLANGLKERNFALSARNGFNDPAFNPPDYRQRLVFEKGIYTVHQDEIVHGDKVKPDNNEFNSRPFEKFYFTVADYFGSKYYDPQSFPALQDSAADQGWYWNIQNASHLHYRFSAMASDSLRIASNLPERFHYLTLRRIAWLIPFLVFLFLLVRGLYEWLRLNTHAVFLMKYLKDGKDETRPVNQTTDKLNTTLNENIDCMSPENGYPLDLHEADINKEEKLLLEKVRKCKDAFDLIWKECSDKEKYILNDFSYDGLINYKNTAEIYDLIGKGIFTVDNEKIKLFNPAFRAYVLTKADAEDIKMIHKQYQKNSTWRSLRDPLALIMFLIVMATIIFFTQEALFQKLLVLASGIGTVIALIPKITGSAAKAPPQ